MSTDTDSLVREDETSEKLVQDYSKESVDQYSGILHMLRTFNPHTIRYRPVVLFIGRRNSGKTHCVKHVVSVYTQEKPVQKGIIIDPTYNNHIEETSNAMTYYSSYVEDTIQECLNKQAHTESHDVFIVVDNCSHEIDWKTSISMRRFFQNNRHDKVSLFITMPYALALSLPMRTCIDYLFIFKDNSDGNKRRLFEQYGAFFPSYDVFSKTIDQLEEYECIVIDNTINSKVLEDIVFKYKAPGL